MNISAPACCLYCLPEAALAVLLLSSLAAVALQSMLFAQASSACNRKMTEISDGQVANICSSTCQTSECQDVSSCLLAAVPLSIGVCAQECLTADDAVGSAAIGY